MGGLHETERQVGAPCCGEWIENPRWRKKEEESAVKTRGLSSIWSDEARSSNAIYKRGLIISMMKMKSIHTLFLFVAIVGIVSIVGCSVPGAVTGPTAPTVVSTSPADSATVVAVNGVITATFSTDMNAATIIGANFSVAKGAANVLGAVTYDAPTKTAMFAPSVLLTGSSTVYTVTITTGVKNAAGTALAADKVWSFTTTALGVGPAPLVLGFAGNYTILAKTTITTTPALPSSITGNIGLSPGFAAAITGFSLTAIPLYGGATSAQVSGGIVYAADQLAPTPANLTIAVGNMLSAYTDAAGRVATLANTDLYSGAIGGKTFTGGLYKWTTPVTIGSSVTLDGAANDIWIFQIAGTLTASSAIHVNLINGAQAKNVFWQVAGAVTLGTTSHFEGIILGQTGVSLGTSATMNGLILAQTAVTLDRNTVTKP